MLTASVRRDGYSAFGMMNPRATFPAIALAWVFTEEKFMKKTSSWLSYGKLRFSWGENAAFVIIIKASSQLLNTDKVSIQTTASYLIASGF